MSYYDGEAREIASAATGGEMRGIGVMKTETIAEARKLLDTDPMVQAGRLIFEAHVWMVGKGVLS